MPERMPGASRTTRQRGEILELLEQTSQFRSAQDLHFDLRARGSTVGLTTVYRTLQTLADSGEVDAMRLPDGGHLYRRCSRVHHHHLVCRHCARTIEISGPDMERWAVRVASQHGYTDVNHVLELFGVCPRCDARDG